MADALNRVNVHPNATPDPPDIVGHAAIYDKVMDLVHVDDAVQAGPAKFGAVGYNDHLTRCLDHSPVKHGVRLMMGRHAAPDIEATDAQKQLVDAKAVDSVQCLCAVECTAFSPKYPAEQNDVQALFLRKNTKNVEVVGDDGKIVVGKNMTRDLQGRRAGVEHDRITRLDHAGGELADANLFFDMD